MPKATQTQATTKPTNVSVDVQDPLPEASFTWRRLITFILVGATIFISLFIAHKTVDPSVLRTIIFVMGVLCGVQVIMYSGGATATDLSKILQAASLLRSGISFQTTNRAQTDDATVESTSTAGLSTVAPSEVPMADGVQPAAPAKPATPSMPAVPPSLPKGTVADE